MIFDGTPGAVLAVYAHPDDTEIACGASLARWAGAGARVHVCLVTNGDKGAGPAGLGPADLADLRWAETLAAAEILGVVGTTRLGHADGEIDAGPALIGEIVEVVRSVRPDVVCCPDPSALVFGDGYVNHRDHRVTGSAALDAVAWAAPNAHYYPGRGGPPHATPAVLLSGTLEPTAFVDVTDTLEVKVAAIACHGSQLDEGGDMFAEWLPARAAETGRAAGLAHAEAFHLLRLA